MKKFNISLFIKVFFLILLINIFSDWSNFKAGLFGEAPINISAKKE